MALRLISRFNKHQSAAEQAHAADRLAACKIGPFLRFGISPSPKVSGVGERRKSAADGQSVGPQAINAITPGSISMATRSLSQ
jgi:hypothetical protein